MQPWSSVCWVIWPQAQLRPHLEIRQYPNRVVALPRASSETESTLSCTTVVCLGISSGWTSPQMAYTPKGTSNMVFLTLTLLQQAQQVFRALAQTTVVLNLPTSALRGPPQQQVTLRQQPQHRHLSLLQHSNDRNQKLRRAQISLGPSQSLESGNATPLTSIKMSKIHSRM
jgi:hypothetical protein